MDGLEIAVKCRSMAEENSLALELWLRLIHAEDPDAEAERIALELKQTFEGIAVALKAVQPVMRAYYDIAGPN